MIVAATLIASVTGLFVGLETSSAGAAQSVPATGPPRASWSRRPGFQRTFRTGRGRIIGQGRERSQVELHADDVGGSGGNR